MNRRRSIVIFIIFLAISTIALSLIFYIRFLPFLQNNGSYDQFINYKPEIVDWPYMGNKDAPITLVMYTDQLCDACRTFEAEYLPILEENYTQTGKMRIYFKPFLQIEDVQSYTLNYWLSAMMYCAAANSSEQYWSLYNKMSSMSRDEISRLLPKNYSCDYEVYLEQMAQENELFGITLEPTFFIGVDGVDNTMLSGLPSYDVLRRRIREKEIALGME